MKSLMTEARAGRDPQSIGDLKSSVLRTPETRFDDLADWPHAPSYLTDLPGFDGLRLHYVDIGNRQARRTVLCLHGQKTWGDAVRKAFRHFTDHGFRVVAPDLFGFGRSDKPASEHVYDFDFHRNSVLALIKRLDLRNLVVAGFDWGGWIGATLPMAAPDRIDGLLLGNMTLHTPTDEIWAGFHVWRALHNAQLDPAISDALILGNPDMGAEVAHALDAPFPDFRYKAGVRKFPNLIPLTRSNPTTDVTEAAVEYLKERWGGACVLAAGMEDPVLGVRSMKRLRTIIRGAQPVIKLKDAGPLIFEHADAFLSEALDGFI